MKLHELMKQKLVPMEKQGFTYQDGYFEEGSQDYFCYIVPPGKTITDKGALYLYGRDYDREPEQIARELFIYASAYFHGKEMYDPFLIAQTIEVVANKDVRTREEQYAAFDYKQIPVFTESGEGEPI